MKRIFSVLLISAFLLTGCKGSGDAPTETSEPAVTTTITEIETTSVQTEKTEASETTETTQTLKTTQTIETTADNKTKTTSAVSVSEENKVKEENTASTSAIAESDPAETIPSVGNADPNAPIELPIIPIT